MDYLIKKWLWRFFLIFAGWQSAHAQALSWDSCLRQYALEVPQNQALHTVADLPGTGTVFYLAREKKDRVLTPDQGWKWVRQLGEGQGILQILDPQAALPQLQEQFDHILPANDLWKLSPAAARKLNVQDRAEKRFLVQTDQPEAFLEFLRKKALDKRIAARYPGSGVFLLQLNAQEIYAYILPCPLALFIDIRPLIPSTELALANFDLSVNKVNTLHARHPMLNGAGQTVSVKEFRPDSTDIDFRDRYLPSGISTPFVANHATIMTTIIAGGGNSFYTGKGVAWRARVSSASFLNLFPESDAYYQTSAISVQNHSYGVGMENYYGAEAQAYDAHVARNPGMIHVFSAGNSGDSTSKEGPYTGISGFANLTGTFKMGKNILTVGAIDSFYQVESRSSHGPAFDGRVKPELVAFGQDGSSGAAAIVSGAALVLQQAYRETYGVQPPAALLRAILLNSADDLGTEGPDFLSGYGSVNAARAMENLENKQWVRGTLLPGATFAFPLEVPEGAANLKITLAWTDTPAQVNTARALVNDLDLRLNSNDDTWLPWVLNTFPHPDSLAQGAKRGTDRLNNQEQITLRNPDPGSYTIAVQASATATGTQEFFLAFSWANNGAFQWTYPAAGDNVPAGRAVPVRWETTLDAAQNAQLAFAFAGSTEWIPINNDAGLSSSYAAWQVPDTTALAVLRMRTPAGIFYSDTFTISRPLAPRLEFDCADSLLWSWSPLKGISRYQLYAFEKDYLTPIMEIADTAVILKKTEFPSAFFSVAPVIAPGKTGLRSPTLRRDFLNSGCYIRSFLANRVDDNALLRLELGTNYQVEEVFFEKKVNGIFERIAALPVSGTAYQLQAGDLENGYTTFRAGIRLANGQRLYSVEDAVLFVREGAYLLFPNPVALAQELFIASNKPEGDIIVVYDALGRLILREKILSELDRLPAGLFSKGMYFYAIEREGRRRQNGTFLVY